MKKKVFIHDILAKLSTGELKLYNFIDANSGQVLLEDIKIKDKDMFEAIDTLMSKGLIAKITVMDGYKTQIIQFTKDLNRSHSDLLKKAYARKGNKNINEDRIRKNKTPNQTMSRIIGAYFLNPIRQLPASIKHKLIKPKKKIKEEDLVSVEIIIGKDQNTEDGSD